MGNITLGQVRPCPAYISSACVCMCVYVKSSQGAAKFKSRLADLKGIPDSIYVCLAASGRSNAAELNPQGRPIKVTIHHVLSGSLAINTSG